MIKSDERLHYFRAYESRYSVGDIPVSSLNLRVNDILFEKPDRSPTSFIVINGPYFLISLHASSTLKPITNLLKLVPPVFRIANEM